MPQILQAWLHQYVNHELSVFKLDLAKAEELEIKLPTSVGLSKKWEFQKNIYLSFIDYPKAFDCLDHNKLWIILKKMDNTRPPYLPPEKSVCRSGSNSLNMEQQAGSKMGKQYIKAVYCHLAYLTYMQSTSSKVLGWMKHELESRLSGEISITSDMHVTPPLWQKVKGNWRVSWWKWKRKVKKLS